MKRLLLIACLVAGMAGTAGAIDVAIIVEDNTSRNTVGVDTLLGDFLVNNLGYTVTYRDIDTVQTRTYWNGAGYEKIIVVGNEDALPFPTGNVDSIAASNIPFMVIGSDFFDEVNLGSGKVTQAENTGYVINIGQGHWITKVLQDSVILWDVTSSGNYAISIPDTAHDVQVLLLDKDSKADTGAAMLAVCEAGATIINTGDGRNVANQRRAFLGFWQYQAVPMDSCQWWTIFGRTTAWLDADTGNAWNMNHVCFSGKYEIDQSCVVENSSGKDSIETYGIWNDLYVAQDFDDKHFFIKPRGIAVARKLANVYRSATVELARWRFTLKAKSWDVTPPATYNSNWSLAPLLQSWNGGNGDGDTFSLIYPYACWTYRYGDTTGGVLSPHLWDEGGAQSVGVDMLASYIDSIVVNQDSALNRYHYIDVDTVSLNTRILDTTLFHGWVANVLSVSNSGPGVEPTYYTVVSAQTYRPKLTITFSSQSTTAPTPSIVIASDSLVFTATEGGSNPAMQTNTVSNGSGGALACQSFSDDVAWLTLVTYDDGAPYVLRNTVNITGLTAGYYFGTVTLQCDDADNSPVTYRAALTVEAAEVGLPPASVAKRIGLRKQ